MKKGIVIDGYLSKANLTNLQSGIDRNVRLYDKGQLHHLFGDEPMENAVEVRVIIEEMPMSTGMTDEKCLFVLGQYREFLAKLVTKEAKIDYDRHYSNDTAAALGHCLSMLSDMENFIHEGRREKFFRWLGFIQGILWSFGIYSLNDLRDHNRPPESQG